MYLTANGIGASRNKNEKCTFYHFYVHAKEHFYIIHIICIFELKFLLNYTFNLYFQMSFIT